MIRITLIQKENEIEQIKLKGHAMYDDYGKDIVCAGVSSILTTTVNAILKFSKEAITFEDQNDEFVLTINQKDEITKKLIANMVELFYELEDSYPKNITIRKRG